MGNIPQNPSETGNVTTRIQNATNPSDGMHHVAGCRYNKVQNNTALTTIGQWLTYDRSDLELTIDTP